MSQRLTRSMDQIRLSDVDPDDTAGMDEDQARNLLDENRQRIADLQYVLYAEAKRSLLVVLQSMDTGGKDPIIRDVLNLANSQACRVTAFKKPEGPEAQHDRFRRFHQAMPAKGEIGVFNRSYYDEVVVKDAHDELGEAERAKEYGFLNGFEEILTGNNIRVIKIYLHISKDEQRRRLQQRIDDPTRQWELSESDFKERRFWDGYMRAYEQVIRATHRSQAPWYVIPSNHRWYRDAAAAKIIADELEGMNPRFPEPKIDLSRIEWS